MITLKEEQIIEHYNKACQVYGNVGWQASLWSSEEEQINSFQALLQVILPGFIPKKQVIELLDVGCGQGDLYKFASSMFGKVDYTGIDFSSQMIEIAKKKYPEGNFQSINLNSVDKKYDFIVGSGIFNIRTENHIDYVKKSILKLFDLSKVGISLSFISKGMWESETDGLFYFDPTELLNFCFSVTSFLKFDQVSVPGHFILHLYREN